MCTTRSLTCSAAALLLVGAALLAPAQAADPAFVGTWGKDAAQCKLKQEVEGAPMVISAKGYDQYESHCTFKDVKQTKKGWRITADCSVQGSKQADKFSLRVDGDKLALRRGKAVSAQLIRCK